MSILSYCSVVSTDREALLSALRALHAQRFQRRLYRDPSAFKTSTAIAWAPIRSVLTDAGLAALEVLLDERIANAQRDDG